MLPADIEREAKAKPVIAGNTAVEISGNLIIQQHKTRAALVRSVRLYEECRK